MAEPRYSSEFHQEGGRDVEKYAQRMHSYNPSSFLRSFVLPMLSGGGGKWEFRSPLHTLGVGYISLQIWVDGFVLFVEVCEARGKVLDDRL